MPQPVDPIRPTDAAARALARDLIAQARHGVLAVQHPDGAGPFASRVAVGTDDAGEPVILVSFLSLHTRAMAGDNRASLLVGEPGPRGDPLTHPRLTLRCAARFVSDDDPTRPALRARYLSMHPKAKLYIDFADFVFVRLDVLSAALNGGFGQAFALSPADLRPDAG